MRPIVSSSWVTVIADLSGVNSAPLRSLSFGAWGAGVGEPQPTFRQKSCPVKRLSGHSVNLNCRDRKRRRGPARCYADNDVTACRAAVGESFDKDSPAARAIRSHESPSQICKNVRTNIDSSRFPGLNSGLKSVVVMQISGLTFALSFVRGTTTATPTKATPPKCPLEPAGSECSALALRAEAGRTASEVGLAVRADREKFVALWDLSCEGFAGVLVGVALGAEAFIAAVGGFNRAFDLHLNTLCLPEPTGLPARPSRRRPAALLSLRRWPGPDRRGI